MSIVANKGTTNNDKAKNASTVSQGLEQSARLIICLALVTIGSILGILFKLNSHLIEQIVLFQVISERMRQAQVRLINANMNGTNYTILR